MNLRWLVLMTCCAAMAVAQTPAAGPSRGAGVRPAGRGPGRGLSLDGPRAEQRLAQQLGLDATQQNTLHQALASEQVQRKGLKEKAAGLRTQLATAVRGGDESGIDAATRDLAALQQQQASAHARTLAGFYNSLNATQKARVEPMLNRELGIATPRVGGPGRGAGARGLRKQPAAAQSQQ